jgi:hypothetical protein
MAQKASIYKEKGAPNNDILLDQLKDAVGELEDKMNANIPIFKGEREVGFGVNKAQRGIAADAVISIAKAIKALKGW